jgi:hypothetical protein
MDTQTYKIISDIEERYKTIEERKRALREQYPATKGSLFQEVTERLEYDTMFSSCFVGDALTVTPVSELYKVYSEWNTNNGVYVQSQTSMGRYLHRSCGFLKARKYIRGVQCWCFLGIRIRNPPATSSPSSLVSPQDPVTQVKE